MSWDLDTAKAMKCQQDRRSYIEAHMPKKYTGMMTSFTSVNRNMKDKGMEFIDEIGDAWKGESGNRLPRGKRLHRGNAKGDETKVRLVFVDSADENECREFDVGSSAELKGLFNDYADRRGVSLRCLRFSHAGKTLFLSSAGRKTPEQLEMRDGDIINVHDTSKPADESSCDGEGGNSGRKARDSKKGKAKNKSRGKNGAGGRNKKSQPQKRQEKSLEEYKVEHSKRLTKLHEEAQDSFKAIRQRLNNLVIEQSRPKERSRRPRAPKAEIALPSFVNNPSKEGLGGRAGRSRFEVQVGEVQNLYKTTKKPSSMSSNQSRPVETLDLHGCTKEEALAKLDESLEMWVDAAMRGSYPFVRPATIVCGCGDQILSETVAEWIRSTDRVSNAPRFRRQRELNSR